MHDPDAVLAFPGRALLKDPGERPACFQGRRLLERTGHAPAPAEVLRHHGSNPHFLDFCPQVNPQNRVLDDLVGKIG